MGTFRFHCVICGNSLKVASSLAGGVRECPNCLRVVPIPCPLTFQHEKADCLPVLPPDILAVEIKILCDKCFAKIRVDARLEGYRVNCPVCSAELRVPMWSRPAASSRPEITPLSAEEIDFLTSSVELAGEMKPAI